MRIPYSEFGIVRVGEINAACTGNQEILKMQCFVFLLCFIAAFVAVNSGFVFQLTDNNFDERIRDKEAVLVNFYAPWCSDCKRFEPKYETAASILATKNKFALAKVDCFGTGMATCRKFSVRSWPQLKLFKCGKYEGEYYGDEDSYAIAAFMDGLISQPAKLHQLYKTSELRSCS